MDLQDPKSASVSAQDTRKHLSSCAPAAQAKKTIDLVDSKSASASAQTKRDCNRELAEGELASCPRGLPARKRSAQDKIGLANKIFPRRPLFLSLFPNFRLTKPPRYAIMKHRNY